MDELTGLLEEYYLAEIRLFYLPGMAIPLTGELICYTHTGR
jgi:hypothetical protein